MSGLPSVVGGFSENLETPPLSGIDKSPNLCIATPQNCMGRKKKLDGAGVVQLIVEGMMIEATLCTVLKEF